MDAKGQLSSSALCYTGRGAAGFQDVASNDGLPIVVKLLSSIEDWHLKGYYCHTDFTFYITWMLRAIRKLRVSHVAQCYTSKQ